MLVPEVQAAQLPRSTLHSVEFWLVSVTLKVISGVLSVVYEPLAGALIETDGEVVSTVKVEDDEPTLPASSVWRTSSV